MRIDFGTHGFTIGTDEIRTYNCNTKETIKEEVFVIYEDGELNSSNTFKTKEEISHLEYYYVKDYEVIGTEEYQRMRPVIYVVLTNGIHERLDRWKNPIKHQDDKIKTGRIEAIPFVFTTIEEDEYGNKYEKSILKTKEEMKLFYQKVIEKLQDALLGL